MCLQSSAYFSAERDLSERWLLQFLCSPPPAAPSWPCLSHTGLCVFVHPSSYQIFRERCARCGDLAPGACLRELTHEPLTPQQNPIHTRIKIRDQHFE